MKRETKTVWTANGGTELLVLKSPGVWFIPLGSVDVKTLLELAEAIQDATGDEMISAMKQAAKSETNPQ